MTIHIEFFCDDCNPSQQRRDPGDEVSTGYVKLDADGMRIPGVLPAGWGIGPTARAGMPGHLCPVCFTPEEPVAPAVEGTGPRPSVPTTPPAPGKSPWPSLASPFGAEGE